MCACVFVVKAHIFLLACIPCNFARATHANTHSHENFRNAAEINLLFIVILDAVAASWRPWWQCGVAASPGENGSCSVANKLNSQPRNLKSERKKLLLSTRYRKMSATTRTPTVWYAVSRFVTRALHYTKLRAGEPENSDGPPSTRERHV